MEWRYLDLTDIHTRISDIVLQTKKLLYFCEVMFVSLVNGNLPKWGVNYKGNGKGFPILPRTPKGKRDLMAQRIR